MTYDQFIGEWNNKQVTKYGGQCVALIAEYEAENNLPIVYGDAHSWINNPIMLSHYDWVVNNPNDANQIPPRGAIVVWPLPNEHIAFFDHNVSNLYFETFGQNSGGPTAHFQQNHWANLAGWYTPKQAPPPAVPPPLPSLPVVHPYRIEPIPAKQIRINKDTHKWGLNYDNFTAINANPQGLAHTGDIKTVVAILYHNIGYNYYLEDSNAPSGYNVADCDEYTPPPPAPPPPPPAPPAGPLTAPSSETYDVIVDIPGYLSSNQAINHTNQKVTVPVGSYFVFNKRAPAINLTKTPGTPGAWINPEDNVIAPPEPEKPIEEPQPEAPPALPAPDFADSYKELPKPQLYVAMRDLAVTDLMLQRKTAHMPQYSVTWIAGSFTVNGINYARPKSAADKDWWYGIEWTDQATNTSNIELESDVFNAKTSRAERQALKTVSTADYFWLGVAHVKNFVLGFTGIFGKIKSAKLKNK